MNIEKYIKPEVLRLKGYHLAKRDYSIKLDQNENPFGFPEALKEKFWQRMKHQRGSRYVPAASGRFFPAAAGNFASFGRAECQTARSLHAE